MLKKGSPIRKALGAVSLLWVGSLAGSGLAFLTQVLLARVLAPEGYGIFSTALATVTLLAPLAGFGMRAFWLKVFGAEGWNATRWLPASFSFVLVSTAVAMVLLAGWATWGPHETATRRLLFWLLPLIAGSLIIELVSGKLQLEERYRDLALWQLLPNLVRLLMVMLIVFAASTHPSLDKFAAVYALVALILVIFGSAQCWAMAHGRLSLKGHSDPNGIDVEQHAMTGRVRVSDVARQAWPFGLAGVFYLVYFQIDIVMVKYFAGNEQAGIYNVAFTVMAAVYLLPSVIYQKFLLPKFHRWSNHNRSYFMQAYRFGNGIMLLLGMLTTAAMILLVPWLIPLLFGREYQLVVGLLAILAFCTSVRFLATSVGATLVTQEHMLRKIRYMGTVAVVNVLLNLLLIPAYAAKGAAIATLLSEIILLALYLLGVRWHVFGRDAWRGWSLMYRKNNV